MYTQICSIKDIVKYTDTVRDVNSISPIQSYLTNESRSDIVSDSVLIDGQVYNLNKTFLLGLTDKPNSPRFLLYVCGTKILIGREARFYITCLYDQITDILYVDKQFEKTIEPLKAILLKFNTLRNKFITKFQHYINNTESVTHATFLSTKQTGHHLHNELPGMYQLLEKITVKYIFTYTEIFTKHEHLFPGNKFLRYLSNEEIFNIICNENITLFKNTLPMIQPRLLQNIKAQKSENCIFQKKNKCILLTIRLSKRILTNQFNFLVETINFFEKKFPNSTYLIDGSVQWLNTESSPLFWENTNEQKFVKRLMEELSNIDIYSLVGLPSPIYLKCLEYVDFYVSHCHTPQHKIGYLTNAPGVFHGAYNDKPIQPRPKEKEIEEHRKTSNIFGVGSIATHFPSDCFAYDSTSDQYPAPIEYTADITKCINFLDIYLADIN